MTFSASTLRALDRNESKVYRALLNDPAVKADPNATHTPALKAAWEIAANACWDYRETHGILGTKGY